MNLDKVNKLIVEALQQPIKESCSCGCGTCENKGPLLTEGKVKHLLSEGLQYHIDNKLALHETIYRFGSEKHLSLIKEARRLYSRGVINITQEDKELLETNLGEIVMLEGRQVALDLPLVNEREDALGIYDDGRGNSASIEFTPNGYYATVEGEQDFQIGPAKTVKELTKMLADEGFTNKIFEAKKKAAKKKKDPPIGKPKRGGSKAYYVYVRDPKTKKVKKVSFGSGGLRAKINNPKARKAFAARHKCSQKTDRTKASYWSCRLPRYAKALGLGNNKSTFW